MNLAKKSAKLLRTAAVGAMLTNCLAWAVEPCDSTPNPCFTNVNDYLDGVRYILPDDDLLYVAQPYSTGGAPTTLSINRSQDLNFTQSGVSIPQTGCKLFRGPKPGRLFNTTNDWVVYLNGRPNDAGYCGSGYGQDNIQISWRDPGSSAAAVTLGLDLQSLDNAQLTVADVNQDGYADVIVSDSYQVRIYSASDVNNSAAGLVLVSQYLIPVNIQHLDHTWGDVVAGDVNGDGAIDLIGSGLVGSGFEQTWAMLGVSVCPAKGFVLFGNSPDPSDRYVCGLPFEIRPSKTGEVLSRAGFGHLSPLDAYGNIATHQPPRLAAGDFLGLNTGQVQLFADLIQYYFAADSDGHYRRERQIWQFDANLQPKELSTSRVETLNTEGGVNTAYFQTPNDEFPDYLSVARLHGPGGADADRDQIVMMLNEYSRALRVEILTVDDAGKISTHAPSDNGNADSGLFFSGTDYTHGQGVVDDTPVTGMTVGRFDPPTVNGNANLGKQIAVISFGTRYVYTIDNNWQLQLVSSAGVLAAGDNTFHYPLFDVSQGTLFAGDTQGRSTLLGDPLRITVEGHLQPNLVLAIPPMHIDYVRDANGKADVQNFTVNPSTFNTQYAFTSAGGNEHEDSNTTDVGDSFGGEINGKFYVGANEKDANFSISQKVAAASTWENSKTTKNSNYRSETHTLNATTGFADHLFFTGSRLNLYYYPILGERCPTTAPCNPDQKVQQYLQVSAPDTIDTAELDGTTQEWYQPVQEPGNIFSYPWNIGQMKLVTPQLNLLSGEVWKLTDTSTSSIRTDWKSGGEKGKTTGSVSKWSLDSTTTIALAGNGAYFGGSASFEFDYGHSSSIKGMDTDTTTLDASTGIQVNKPAFSDPVSTQYFYYFAGHIFGQTPSVSSLVDPVLITNGQPVDQQFFGPLTVAFTADPFHGASQASWWRQAYSKPDIGLNHPSRWTWDAVTKKASFNLRSKSPDPSSILSDLFYHMKGLYIGEASDDPDAMAQRSSAKAGDVMRLQARIYNFSVADMPQGSWVRVRFYGQEYDHASLTGDGFLIGETKIAPIPGFKSDSNQGTMPNWRMASTTFDTTNYSGKKLVFWVVAWGEDANGNLLSEQDSHGLTQNPSGMTFKQITDVPVETYSNNVGMYGVYTPFSVAPKLSTGSAAADGGNATQFQADARQLQANDVLVEATPVTKNTLRSWVTVTIHNTTDGTLISEPIELYDGDPENGGKLFDIQRLPYLEKGGTYMMRTFLQPESSGNHNIFVRVGRKEANPNLAITTMTVQ